MPPLLWWKLDDVSGDAADASGNGLTGTRVGSGGITYGAAGVAPGSGASVAFDGSGTAGFQSDAVPDPAGPETIEVFVKPTTVDVYGLVCGFRDSNSAMYIFQLASGGYECRYTNSVGNTTIVPTDTDVPAGVAHHFAFVNDPAGNLELRVDKNIIGSVAGAALRASSPHFAVGYGPSTAGFTVQYNGLIDSVGYWQAALSKALTDYHCDTGDFMADAPLSPAGLIIPSFPAKHLGPF